MQKARYLSLDQGDPTNPMLAPPNLLTLFETVNPDGFYYGLPLKMKHGGKKMNEGAVKTGKYPNYLAEIGIRGRPEMLVKSVPVFCVNQCEYDVCLRHAVSVNC